MRAGPWGRLGNKDFTLGVIGSLGFRLGDFVVISALCKRHSGTVCVYEGRQEAGAISSPVDGSLGQSEGSGDGEKETFKRCSGGRIQSLVIEGMWSLERGRHPR